MVYDVVTLSENRIININTELKLLTELFKCNGWKTEEDNDNLSDHIIYSKPGNETEFFKIALDNNIIYVSVPLKNSDFQYKTKFDNYYSAIKYTESKFNYFNNNINNTNNNENISF
jgi:hypothetical protein